MIHSFKKHVKIRIEDSVVRFVYLHNEVVNICHFRSKFNVFFPYHESIAHLLQIVFSSLCC